MGVGTRPSWAQHEAAASPLVVIATFVLGAIVVTAFVYAVFVDKPETRLQVVATEHEGGLSFEVTQAAGGLSWSQVTLRFVDRAGIDHADTFLQAPNGSVEEGDRIGVPVPPPAGTYVLLLLAADVELTRLIVVV